MQAITTSGKKIRIDDSAEIHRGGEGRILLLKELPQHVAKIYLPHKSPLSQYQLQALRVLDDHYFVKPEELIMDTQNQQVIGFTMPYVPNDYFQLAALFNPQFARKNQLDWGRKINLLRQLLLAIQQAHQANIVIGDLSGLNILVNARDQVKLIDVDAYQTPMQPHSGVLLDEIRDYYLQGVVSLATDAFAFAVIAFNLLTYTHPFKGIHQVYKSLQDRMLQQLPVFKKDSQLIVPKCYEPIGLQALQQQFEEIFVGGKRFLMNLQLSAQQPTPIAPMYSTTPIQGELLIKQIFVPNAHEWIKELVVLKHRVLVKTSVRYLIYDASNYGYLNLTHEFLAKEVGEDMFIGHHQILSKKEDILFAYTPQKKWQALCNINFTTESRYTQLQDILVVVEQHMIKYLYLDQINQDFIQVQQTPAFGQGIQVQGQTVWQQTGGKQYLFYHSGRHISTVQLPVLAVQVFLTAQQGVITHKVQGGQEVQLKNYFFSIQHLKIQLQQEVHTAKHLAIKPTTHGQGIVFEPKDNELVVRRTEDYQVLQTLACSLLTDQSQLFDTQAGVLVVEHQQVYLLNKQS